MCVRRCAPHPAPSASHGPCPVSTTAPRCRPARVSPQHRPRERRRGVPHGPVPRRPPAPPVPPSDACRPAEGGRPYAEGGPQQRVPSHPPPRAHILEPPHTPPRGCPHAQLSTQRPCPRRVLVVERARRSGASVPDSRICRTRITDTGPASAHRLPGYLRGSHLGQGLVGQPTVGDEGGKRLRRQRP